MVASYNIAADAVVAQTKDESAAKLRRWIWKDAQPTRREGYKSAALSQAENIA
jgi:hypothetical protein